MKSDILKKIAEEFKTPAYVFNLDELTEKINQISKCLGNSAEICYAMKANPFLIKHLDELINKFEVCSPGEFAICERANISPDKIVLSGVYKEYKETSRVIETYGDKIIYTIESEQHLEILSSCSKDIKKNLKVLIRLTSGNQFGLDEESICKILMNWDSHPYLDFLGIQFYSGTQKKDLKIIDKELKSLDELCIKLQNNYNIIVPELEYGPGFFTSYFENEEEIDDVKLLNSFREMLENMKFKGKITLEMGRYIASQCGYYITTIVDKKKNLDQNYCIIDGGINHINYYGQAMAMKKPHIRHFASQENGDVEKWNICGSLCTSADVIVKQLPLNNISVNDILVFEKLGAYSITEGIYLFLSRDLPKVIFYSNDNGAQLIRDSLETNTINSAF